MREGSLAIPVELRALEVVESQRNRVVAQSFMDPTKFPVDSLIKRLQSLVSMSLGNVIGALGIVSCWTLLRGCCQHNFIRNDLEPFDVKLTSSHN